MRGAQRAGIGQSHRTGNGLRVESLIGRRYCAAIGQAQSTVNGGNINRPIPRRGNLCRLTAIGNGHGLAGCQAHRRVASGGNLPAIVQSHRIIIAVKAAKPYCIIRGNRNRAAIGQAHRTAIITGITGQINGEIRGGISRIKSMGGAQCAGIGQSHRTGQIGRRHHLIGCRHCAGIGQGEGANIIQPQRIKRACCDAARIGQRHRIIGGAEITQPQRIARIDGYCPVAFIAHRHRPAGRPGSARGLHNKIIKRCR